MNYFEVSESTLDYSYAQCIHNSHGYKDKPI